MLNEKILAAALSAMSKNGAAGHGDESGAGRDMKPNGQANGGAAGMDALLARLLDDGAGGEQEEEIEWYIQWCCGGLHLAAHWVSAPASCRQLADIFQGTEDFPSEAHDIFAPQPQA